MSAKPPAEARGAESGRPARPMRTFGRLMRNVLRYRARLAIAAVCTVLVSLLSVASLTLLVPVIQVLFGEGGGLEDMDPLLGSLLAPVYAVIEWTGKENPLFALGAVSAFFLFVTAVNGGFRYAQEYFIHWIGNRVILDLQQDVFRRLSRFNTAYFALNRTGALVSYFTVDFRVIGLALFHVLGRVTLDPCTVLAALALLLYLNWRLTLLYALVLPAALKSVQYFAGKNRRAGRITQERLSQMGSFLHEHFGNIRLVQGYRMYGHQERRFHERARAVFASTMTMVKARSASSPVNEFLGMCAACCVLMLGGYFIFHKNQLTRGEFILFIACLGRIYQPMRRLEKALQEVQHGIAAAERVFAANDLRAETPVPENPVPVTGFEKSIAFRRVDFSYDGESKVLRGIDLTVPKGSLTAFVGPSGAGKTTLMNLIPRFYDPVSGIVELDGRDLRELDLDGLRSLISIVPQETMVFADTVRANIACGADYDDEAIRAAARAAFADEFIEALPDGYGTGIGERGVGLSGGQCQRLALARAFLRDTPILLLDEATSSLDSESEHRIRRSMEQLMRGRTACVIAHRLSTILHADQIVVMEEGRIVDAGPHEALLERCGLYQKLYHLQYAANAAVER